MRVYKFLTLHKLYGISEFLVKVIPLTGENAEEQRARARKMLANHVGSLSREVITEGTEA